MTGVQTCALPILISVFVTLLISRISGAWQFIMECGAGVGLVLILRWFWWRVNAWSEISAMITPFVVYPIIKYYGVEFPNTLFYLVTITTIVWVSVTYFTKPTDEETLLSFYKKIHPGGILWKKISDTLPDVKSDTGFAGMFVNWIIGVALVYSILFGSGSLIFGNIGSFFLYLILAIICTIIITFNLSKIDWSENH